MLSNYSNFINYNLIKEGSSDRPETIYWGYQLKDLLVKDWTEISTSRYTDNKCLVKFRSGPDKYDFCAVIFEAKNIGGDFYYMEDNVSEKFIKKFKAEFWKNASEYVKKLQYSPKCLGDLSHVRDAEKYNL